MKSYAPGSTKLVTMVSALVLVPVALGAMGLLTSCSSAAAGSSTAENTTLEDSVNARLDSRSPCGVYATTDGAVRVTLTVDKSTLGDDAAAAASAKSVVRRVLTEIPEVKSVQVLDNSKQVIGDFLPNQ
jgi:hypothetical protein